MPKIINAYAGDDSLANAFQGFANTFMTNTPQMELARQKAFGLRRDNRAYQVLQDRERAGGFDANDPEARAAVVGLDKPLEFSQAQRFLTSSRYGAADPRATNAYVGAGGSYSGTVAGTREAEANRVAIEDRRTQRLFDAERYKADNLPYEAIVDGKPVVMSRRAAIEGRATPVLNHGQAQGVILQADTPTLTPEQRASAGGYAPKNPGNLWTYQTPEGRQGTTADGRTDVASGQPIPPGTKTIKLEGPSTEGLTNDATVNRDLTNSEVAMKQSVAMIDNLASELSKPNAAQSVGYVGAIANTLNGWRAQAEAASTAIGGLTKDQAVSDPGVKQAIDGALISLPPQVVSRMQQMGIDGAIVRSQIHDLAYVIARAQDPSGRISVDDVRRASETIGASLMDPQAGVRVLADLKNRIQTNWKIKDETIRARYARPGAPPAAAPAPLPASPTAPQNNVVDWQTYFGAPQ